MRLMNSTLAMLGFIVPALFAGYACGGSNGDGGDAGDNGGAGGSGANAGAGGAGGSLGGNAGNAGSAGAGGSGGSGTSMGTYCAPDDPMCSFPSGGPPCAPNTPAIQVVYPNDGVLVPPNMSTISVQWTPFG